MVEDNKQKDSDVGKLNLWDIILNFREKYVTRQNAKKATKVGVATALTAGGVIVGRYLIPKRAEIPGDVGQLIEDARDIPDSDAYQAEKARFRAAKQEDGQPLPYEVVVFGDPNSPNTPRLLFERDGDNINVSQVIAGPDGNPLYKINYDSAIDVKVTRLPGDGTTLGTVVTQNFPITGKPVTASPAPAATTITPTAGTGTGYAK